MAGETTDWAMGSLLSYMVEQDREYLQSLGMRRSFRQGEVLIRHGDLSDFVFLLISGWVRVSQVSSDSQEMLLALRGPGDVLGDLAALFGEPRTATVQSMEPVEVIQLTANRFATSLRERPDIAIAMVKQMGVRLREAESVRMDFSTLDVGHRVAAYLNWLTKQHGRPSAEGVVIEMPLTQQDIASRVGASLRAVARALALLRERGVIRTSRRQLVIVRPAVLRAFTSTEPGEV